MKSVISPGRILLSHPHAAAVSTGLATALGDHQRLAAFFTGVSAASGTLGAAALSQLSRRWPTLANRIQSASLTDTLRAFPAVELVARGVAATTALGSRPLRAYDCIFTSHDWAVSHWSWPSDVAVVYAYEDGALATFRRARRRGLCTVWDLPLPHHTFLSALWAEEARRTPSLGLSYRPEPRWKMVRKDTELGMASAVCVASAFTRSTLPPAALNRPVLVVPYGFPSDAFPAKLQPPSGQFTALSVGMHDVRKGTHYLLRAWKRAGLKDARLRLVGPLRLPRNLLAEFEGSYEHVSHVPRAHLAAEYHAADLLVFPTLGDGFGLVIQEAMCSGTPVLTTPCGGGPECLVDGREGWIVPPRDEGALVEMLRAAASDRNRLYQMGLLARRRAESWTWKDAAHRLWAELTAHLLV